MDHARISNVKQNTSQSPLQPQLINALMLSEQSDQQHISAGKLPQIKNIKAKIQKCQSPKGCNMYSPQYYTIL